MKKSSPIKSKFKKKKKPCCHIQQNAIINANPVNETTYLDYPENLSATSFEEVPNYLSIKSGRSLIAKL